MDNPTTVRVLNACPACDRQYDVSHLDVGRKVLCACGERFDVHRQKPHDPLVLKCGHCGGLLKEGARSCEYCSAEITLEERRMSSVCPKCFARMAVDARYCMECGVKIDPQAIYALDEGTRCSRCKGELRRRALGSTQVVECSACGGIWLSVQAFLRLCERAEATRACDESLADGKPAQAALEPEPVHYIPCPVCGCLMGRKNYGRSSGVIIDTCYAHGVWLDDRELARILAFIRAGGLDRERQREIERLHEEQRRTDAELGRLKSVWTSRLRGSPPGVGPNLVLNGILDAIDLLF